MTPGRVSPEGDHDRAGGAYAFGDTLIAANRLALLAEVFEPSSWALLSTLHDAPTDVLDLGCGPGHTTAMLSRRFPTATVVGLDQSDAFLAAARDLQLPSCRFALADVAKPPLPHAPAGLIYSRFLLAHLSQPCELLDAWVTQLRPGGVLVVEEPEGIDTDDPLFADYLRLAVAIVDVAGGQMYAGRLLDGCQPDHARVLVNRVTEHTVSGQQAARMFALNLAAWGATACANGLTTDCDLHRLRDGLRAHLDDGRPGCLRWGLRQLVLER